MDLYLAGGISGNLKPIWTDFCKNKYSGGVTAIDLYLAGLQGKRGWGAYAVTGYLEAEEGKQMDLYLAGGQGERRRVGAETIEKLDVAILESFYYVDDWIIQLIPKLSKFLLDSGAFTFMTSHKGKVDWNSYLRRYADFINTYDIKLFFELDIDSIIGYENVLQMRKWLELETGKKPIPVWHKSRGKEDFLKMCAEYEYVSIGGIVSKEIKPPDYKYFPWFINEAHKRGAKIHGLGFTNLEGITKYHFDSVDSTSWTTGNRFGAVYRFNGRTMEKFDKKEGQRLKDSRAVAINNFNEWVKFQRYARTNL